MIPYHTLPRTCLRFSVGPVKDVHATFVTEYTYSAGPSLGWAVVACVFGLAGAIAVLVLRARATTEQDGPFKKCGTTVGPSAAPAVGTV